ncbi:MAG: hypothetical protein IJF75_02830 [Clostridia bacterium]|nr:hypothetical protein [Clostridia bacterium]
MDLSNLINILPSILGNNSKGNVLETLLPLLTMDKNGLNDIFSALNSVLDGSINLKDLLIALLPIILEYFGKTVGAQEEIKNATENEVTFNKVLGIEPVRDLADEKTLSELVDYLESSTAS